MKILYAVTDQHDTYKKVRLYEENQIKGKDFIGHPVVSIITDNNGSTTIERVNVVTIKLAAADELSAWNFIIDLLNVTHVTPWNYHIPPRDFIETKVN